MAETPIARPSGATMRAAVTETGMRSPPLATRTVSCSWTRRPSMARRNTPVGSPSGRSAGTNSPTGPLIASSAV